MNKIETVIDKVLDACSKKLATRLFNVAGHVDPVYYRSILGETMEDLKCSFVFYKGKRAGETCGVLLCQHHPHNGKKRKRKQLQNPFIYEEKKNETPIFPNNSTLNPFNEIKEMTMEEVLNQSLMEANIDDERRIAGLPTLGVVAFKKK